MQPLKPVSPGARIALGADFFAAFLAAWALATNGGYVPPLILWGGVGAAQRLAVIFIGSVFQLVIMVAVIAGSTRMDLVEAAYTLGPRPLSILRRVVIPAAAPQVAETLRLVLGWAWT